MTQPFLKILKGTFFAHTVQCTLMCISFILFKILYWQELWRLFKYLGQIIWNICSREKGDSYIFWLSRTDFFIEIYGVSNGRFRPFFKWNLWLMLSLWLHYPIHTILWCRLFQHRFYKTYFYVVCMAQFIVSHLDNSYSMVLVNG